MNQPTAARKSASASRGREKQVVPSHASTSMAGTVHQQCYVRVLAYPVLRQWPELAPAVTVHLNMGTKQKTGIRVPVKLMRKCGMFPELGVNVATFKNRVVIWGDKRGGMYQQAEDSKQFMLPRSGLSTKVTRANFAIVEGPDYLVLTTRADALKLAGDAQVVERKAWQKVERSSATQLDEDLDPSAIAVLGWKDVTVGHCHRMRSSRVANVSGHLWWMAGFNCGDALRFTRYRNATVVEKCAPGDKHSTVSQSGARDIPRHYFGNSLVDIQNTDKVRVIALRDRLIVTTPESSIGAACTEATYQPRVKQAVIEQERAQQKILEVLTADSIEAISWKDYTVVDSRMTVSGLIWAAAGFEARHPARLIHYANALVIEACDEQAMEFRVGSPSQDLPYRNIGLAGTALAEASQVRVIVAKGRVVLTTTGGPLAKKCRHVAPWPTDKAQVADLLARAVAVPATEVGSYAVPEGRRLQIQGKWLSKFGFKPGTKFGVTAVNGELRVELGAENGWTVTEHSPGTSKLYVPAQSLELLNTDKVRVFGREGMLQLLPLAA